MELDRNVRRIEEELQRVLQSRLFSKSSQLKRLLEYIVSRWLAGDINQLDGYNLAIAVFGRGESFESSLDPIVRVQVSRLRNQLAHYYAGEGATNLLRIDIPKGTYVPAIYEQLRSGDPPRGPTDSLRVSVMLLPFIPSGDVQSISGSHAIALSDHLIYLLTRSSGLRVTARISSTHLDPALDARQLGDHFGTQFIIEGTVSTVGDECQVVVHLAETTNGYNIWSGLYAEQPSGLRDLAERIYRDLLDEMRNIPNPG